MFYSNRAACYINLTPPEYEKVVVDCDEALKLDSTYVKALNRRATALESLDRHEEALRGMSTLPVITVKRSSQFADYTAATILNKFQNEAAAQSVERVLKKLAGEKAQAILSVCPLALPPLESPLNHVFRVVNSVFLHIHSCPHISVPSALVSI